MSGVSSMVAKALPLHTEVVEGLAELTLKAADWYRTTLQNNSAMLREWAAHLEALEKAAPVPGYEEFYIGRGHDRLTARLLARFTLRLGRDFYAERLGGRRLVSEIHALLRAKNPTTLVVSRRANKIAALVDGPAWAPLAEAFGRASLHGSEYEFIAVLKLAQARDSQACRRLLEICALLQPQLPEIRGPVPSRTSITHELLLFPCRDLYRNSGVAADYPDAATCATRAAFGNALFDPRPAHRRLHKTAKRNRCLETAPI